MSKPPAVRQRLITASVMLATIMYSLDSTIANVALPHIRGSVSATSEQAAWVLTSYMVAMAIATPLTGWLAGRFGRKRILLYSIVGFTAISAACGMATGLSQIVLFRTLQGACGAALVPLSQAMLLDIYPPEDHGRAMAIWVGGVMVAPILGPILGGWLTDHASWRWIFYINLPIGILAFLGIQAFASEQNAQTSKKLDVFGYASLSIGIGALQLMLDRGQLRDWFSAPEICIEATVAGLSLYLSAVHTATAESPFINRTLLRDRNFVIATAGGVITGLLFNATMALLPTMMQDLLDYPAINTGIVMSPRGIGTMMAVLVLGSVIKKMDVRILLATGIALQCVALMQMGGFNLQMDATPAAWSGFLQGIGIGLTFVPLSTLAFSSLQAGLRTDAAALNTLMRTLGGSIGISITQAQLTQHTQAAHARLIEYLRPDNPAAQLAADFSTTTGLATLNGEATRQAAMLAYLYDYRMMLFLGFVLLAMVPLLRMKQAPAGRE